MSYVHVRTSWLLAALLSAFASAAAQGQTDWGTVLAAAKKEGKVVLYTNTVPAVNERLKTDFEAANPGISLEYTRIVGAPIVAKLVQERQASIDGADATLNYEFLWMVDAAKSASFRPPTGPARRVWPAKYWVVPGVPLLNVEPFVFVYNTDLIKQELTGYRDFLKPEFKGKIGTTELAAATVVAWYEWLEKTQGPDFLPKFAAQAPKLYVGSSPTTQAAASGEVVIGAFSIFAVAKPLAEKGAPIKIVLPKPALGTAFGGAALAWSRRPNAAQVFLDYVMSVRGQTLLNGQGGSASPLPNIPGSLDIETITFFDAARYTPEVMKAYTERWNKLFKR